MRNDFRHASEQQLKGRNCIERLALFPAYPNHERFIVFVLTTYIPYQLRHVINVPHLGPAAHGGKHGSSIAIIWLKVLRFK